LEESEGDESPGADVMRMVIKMFIKLKEDIQK
jgi:hypothetical protein